MVWLKAWGYPALPPPDLSTEQLSCLMPVASDEVLGSTEFPIKAPVCVTAA